MAGQRFIWGFDCDYFIFIPVCICVAVVVVVAVVLVFYLYFSLEICRIEEKKSLSIDRRNAVRQPNSRSLAFYAVDINASLFLFQLDTVAGCCC